MGTHRGQKFDARRPLPLVLHDLQIIGDRENPDTPFARILAMFLSLSLSTRTFERDFPVPDDADRLLHPNAYFCRAG
jgi:hypothetical protein